MTAAALSDEVLNRAERAFRAVVGGAADLAYRVGLVAALPVLRVEWARQQGDELAELRKRVTRLERERDEFRRQRDALYAGTGRVVVELPEPSPVVPPEWRGVGPYWSVVADWAEFGPYVLVATGGERFDVHDARPFFLAGLAACERAAADFAEAEAEQVRGGVRRLGGLPGAGACGGLLPRGVGRGGWWPVSAHAKKPSRPWLSRLADRINAAWRWVWADRHDDEIPDLVQALLLFAALVLFFFAVVVFS